MTIRDMYAAIGSDYDAVLSRLMKDSLVQRLVLKYPDDKSFEKLTQCLKDKDYEEAFNAVHTIKGLAGNLGFDRLGKSASDLCEELRAKRYDNLDALYTAVEQDQETVLDYIEHLDK